MCSAFIGYDNISIIFQSIKRFLTSLRPEDLFVNLKYQICMTKRLPILLFGIFFYRCEYIYILHVNFSQTHEYFYIVFVASRWICFCVSMNLVHEWTHQDTNAKEYNKDDTNLLWWTIIDHAKNEKMLQREREKRLSLNTCAYKIYKHNITTCLNEDVDVHTALSN